MKRKNLLRLMVTLSLAAVVSAGCAKKPAPLSPTMGQQETPVVSQMPSRQVSGFSQQAIGESQGGAGEGVLGAMAVAGLERIQFDYDQFTLSPQATEILTRNAAYLKANPTVKVVIEGHCDERGSDEYNLALGERRARAAKTFLTSLGISETRLSVISYGEELPLDPSRSSEAMAKNRRAEFKAMR